MIGRYDETTKAWYFDSVQDFWDAERLDGQAAYVRKGRFQGKLQKSQVGDRELGEFPHVDLECGIEADTLIVMQVLNLDRGTNHYRLQPPPRRTGIFSAFMDEVEEVAFKAGCRLVWVEDVFNEFLPEKLEMRGYQKLPGSENPHPDYIRILPRTHG